jgi:hypothetical protein
MKKETQTPTVIRVPLPATWPKSPEQEQREAELEAQRVEHAKKFAHLPKPPFHRSLGGGWRRRR